MKSIFRVNNFCYVINWLIFYYDLNINRFTIFRTKCLGIVTLRVLPTTCFRYNSEETSSKFPIPKMKLNRIEEFSCASSIIKCWENFEKMTAFYEFFDHFSRKVYTFISALPKMFLLSYCLMVWWWLQMKARLFANVSKKEMYGVFALILCISLIFKYFNIACNNKYLKFNLFFISKFKFDRFDGRSYKGTALRT